MQTTLHIKCQNNSKCLEIYSDALILIQKCLHKVILFLSQAHCYFSRNNPKLVNTGLKKHAMCFCMRLYEIVVSEL